MGIYKSKYSILSASPSSRVQISNPKFDMRKCELPSSPIHTNLDNSEVGNEHFLPLSPRARHRLHVLHLHQRLLVCEPHGSGSCCSRCASYSRQMKSIRAELDVPNKRTIFIATLLDLCYTVIPVLYAIYLSCHQFINIIINKVKNINEQEASLLSEEFRFFKMAILEGHLLNTSQRGGCH